MSTLMVPGFSFSAVSAGIKQERKLDMTLIYSEKPAALAACYTQNRTVAAPVILSKKNAKKGLCQAVIINSGNANACTGKTGLRDAATMAKETAKSLKIADSLVQVCSTGKIGIPMPMSKITRSIPSLCRQLSPDQLSLAADAILTTDQGPKISSATGKYDGSTYRMVGFAKGAGMIAPHLVGLHATMLAYVVTDLSVPTKILQKIFEEAVSESFNRVTVDGDMSTNDTALLLANGFAGNKRFDVKSRDGIQFIKNLKAILLDLAKKMVMDGEGATHCVNIQVEGFRKKQDAEKVAWTIANSPLVKTSFFGEDPNWGRILAAVGRSGVDCNPEMMDVFYGPVCVAKKGSFNGDVNERAAKKIMKEKEFAVKIVAREGREGFSVYTSDLTLDYVKLNSHYRT